MIFFFKKIPDVYVLRKYQGNSEYSWIIKSELTSKCFIVAGSTFSSDRHISSIVNYDHMFLFMVFPISF